MSPAPAIRRSAALITLAAAAAGALAMVPQQALANGCLFPPVWDPDTNTYTITTAEQLRTLHQGACDMSATIRLANDIDLTGTGEFLPIGSAMNNDPFTGTFDGGGHTITGLQISAPSEDGFGLFGSVTGATIRNIRVSGTVVGNASGPGSVNGGLLVGLATNAAISNAHVEGAVSTAAGAGGLAGLLSGGSISDSTAAVQVTSVDSAGGLVGFVNAAWVTFTPAAITNARTSGTVSSSVSFAGGIAGSSAGTSIARSNSSANVTGNMAGGIVGQTVSGGLPGIAISDSYSTGSVSATSNSTGSVGGIAGGLCNDMLIDMLRNYFSGRLIPAGSATSGGIDGGAVFCPLSIAAQATTTGNLWNSDTTGPAGAGGTVGVGRTTAQMKQIGTYTELGWSITNGWDANPTTTWLICAQVNDGYPFQRGQVSASPCRAPAEAPAASKAAAGLTATLLPSRRRVVSGQRMRVGIRTTNNGGTAAQGVTSCIRLPSNMVITSAGGATRSGRTACFRVGTLAAGGTTTKVLTMRAVTTRRVRVTVTGSARATGVAKVQAAAKRVTVTPRAARARVTG